MWPQPKHWNRKQRGPERKHGAETSSEGLCRGSNSELKLRRVERDQSRVEGMILKDKLKACQRSKRSLSEQFSRTKGNMWAIIDQYKEKLNLASTHEQRLEDECAKVSVL